MIAAEQQKAARAFAENWKGKGYEKGDTQRFWLELLQKVLGVEDPYKFIEFEDQVLVDSTNFMDGYIPATQVLIEQKSIEKELGKPIKQSDGSYLNPFQQAKKYIIGLPRSRHPRWVVTCNFREFWVYDMERPNDEPQKILLENLEKEYYRLQFLVDEGNEHLKREMEVSVKAGNLVGVIYDKLLERYLNPESQETLRSLNVLCVRLVFCLYAEDAGLLGSRTAFHDYLVQYPSKDIRRALFDLFDVLDTPIDKRDPYLNEDLLHFPYINGGLFSHDEQLQIPNFTDELKELLLQKASDDFDWSDISPTIFGAIFESTLNPETRRSGGMHYTSIENIHKVIDPLFLNALREEFESIKAIPQEKQQRQRLDAFQDKLASLTFFDPACGSGNFLTESYISLRRLENQVIALRNKGQAVIGDFANPVKVDIHQFYGIEINDFAVSVATTALWIAEQQMMQETEKIASFAIDPLPLKPYHNIIEGNALRIDWTTVIAPEKLNYIMGNPPFVGARWMNKEQKQDVIDIFGTKWQGVGDLDYVCCWYKKAIDFMEQNHVINTALVSTNSITQGGAVSNLWKPLIEKYDAQINFAYRTFRWDSEADIKAHVHCVIIGFSVASLLTELHSGSKTIYISDNQTISATNINGYLLDAPNIFIEKRTQPICNVPSISLGGQPIDDGNFILTEEEKIEFLKIEPQALQFIRPFMMGKDFINRKPRFCLWLKDANPSLLRQCHHIIERVQNVREFRMRSNRESTLKAADTPTLFGAPFECKENYIALPKVSSENRRYIPIDYLSPDIIPGDKLFCMQNATLYHFGILNSNVHMSWMRAVCGRLKSDYSYSNTIVYNNFPWPTPTGEQKAKIEQTAQAILDARALYPGCSLADLYDEVTMPPELRRAHQENDRAVMAAYGFSTKMTESECVAGLFKMYQELTK